MAVNKHEGDSCNRQAKRSYDHKDDGMGSRLFKLPPGVTIFKWEKEKKYKHLIVAWHAGKNHPLVKSGEFNEGDWVYSVEFQVHKGLGVDEKGVSICLKNTFGKKCPVCEYINEMAEKGKKEIADKIKPKKQVGYIIYDVKEGEEKFYILSQPHFCFEKGMIEAARTAADDDEGLVDFAYRNDKGAIIKYMVKEGSFMNRKFLTLADGTSFKEISKEDELPVKFLSKVFCLDDCLNIPTYEEAQKMLYADDDDDDDDDESEQENEDEDEKPKTSRKNDDDDEPRPKKKKGESVENECPCGHRFGVDIDKPGCEDDCDSCKLYVKCNKAKKGK
jgi:hypothetical protein